MSSVAPVVPRWEWRVFGGQFADIEARLNREHAEVHGTGELYLLGPSDDINVKVRGDQLEIKRRLRVAGGLELWSPVFKAAFPMDTSAIVTLFGHWGLPVPPLSRASYTVEQFLAEVAARCAELRVVRVGKARRRCSIGDSLVELTVLNVDGHESQTVAIESEHPDEVRHVARALGLAGCENVGYIAALRRLLRVTPGKLGAATREEATS
jgi:exopolyphosphatase/guanosine-5'-triphosphate,3'-diphosphate pyrophosphatase